jgi:hypothetical protein
MIADSALEGLLSDSFVCSKSSRAVSAVVTPVLRPLFWCPFVVLIKVTVIVSFWSAVVDDDSESELPVESDEV